MEGPTILCVVATLFTSDKGSRDYRGSRSFCGISSDQLVSVNGGPFYYSIVQCVP